jgi:hypothetical protein
MDVKYVVLWGPVLQEPVLNKTLEKYVVSSVLEGSEAQGMNEIM